MHVTILDSLAKVSPEAWNALVPDNEPFQEHEFLFGLEVTGCVGTEESGWIPSHLIVGSGQEIFAALPLYIKFNSYGEYIFDWGWANAAHQAGIHYYPKLVSAIPFTPATGARLMLKPNIDQPTITNVIRAIKESITKICQQHSLSSCHILFTPNQETEQWIDNSFARRASYQYHFLANQNWRHFDDYLNALRSSIRKQIRKERKQAGSHGLDLRMVEGEEMTDAHWDAMWRFYCNTTQEKHAIPYLNRHFFEHLAEEFRHRVVCAFAERPSGEPLAGSILFHKGQHLYGRYWGCDTRSHLDSMHFELCYYLPIEWGLQRGYTRFEAGAQGRHKLKRGFLANRCHSVHSLRHPGLRDAVFRFLQHEASEVEYLIAAQNEHTPFKTC